VWSYLVLGAGAFGKSRKSMGHGTKSVKSNFAWSGGRRMTATSLLSIQDTALLFNGFLNLFLLYLWNPAICRLKGKQYNVHVRFYTSSFRLLHILAFQCVIRHHSMTTALTFMLLHILAFQCVINTSSFHDYSINFHAITQYRLIRLGQVRWSFVNVRKAFGSFRRARDCSDYRLDRI
jgi:hypothetical protein